MKKRTWVVLLILSVVLIVAGAVLALHAEEGVVRVVPVPTTGVSFPYRIPGCVAGALGVVLLVVSAYKLFQFR